MMPHAHPLEYLLLILSVLAVLYTGSNFWARWEELATARERYKEHSVRWLISVDRFRGCALRFMKCIVLIVGALIALLLPPPPPSYEELPQSLALLIVLCVIACLMMVHSWMSNRAQRELDLLDATDGAKRQVTPE